MPLPALLTARRAAEMISRISAIHAFLVALPPRDMEGPLHSSWIEARAWSAMVRDDLLYLACTEVAVETAAPERV